jgi:uncharacterized protein YhbP (UPF0306 family)
VIQSNQEYMTRANKHLTTFISSQKLLTIATVDKNKLPCIYNAYYSSDNNLRLFFVSSTDTNHGKHLQKQNHVAFSISWFNKDDLTDRKSIQGKGICTPVTDKQEILTFLSIHHKKYPFWRDILTCAYLTKKGSTSHLYSITPSYMKFWNDALFGEEQVEEHEF